MRYASAEVRKEFFTEMFTRDIALEDCILDLIDNSIDSHLQKHNVLISDLVFGATQHAGGQSLGQIDVTCSERQIKVADTCGGISRQEAMKEVFRFGPVGDHGNARLGAYGVGMKRALFKIGNGFHIISRTASEGFEVKLKLDEWVEDEKWRVPIEYVEGASSERTAGTCITITELHDEVVQRIKEGGVPKNIVKDAGSTYPYFLNECVRLRINEADVPPEVVPLGEKDGVIKSATEKFEQDDVSVNLAATIAPGERKSEQAGWYILCNGRAVVRANKDDLTGWGSDQASFQPKYRSFIGVASFESRDPLKLPWTTTKRGINRESKVFMRARGLMVAMSKPVLTFLNAQYPTELTAEVADIRHAVEGVQQVPFKDIAARPSGGFSYTVSKKKEKTTEWVRYSAKIASLDRVRRHLRRPMLSAPDIGRITFDHYLKTECATD